MKKTTIELDDAVYRELKIRAAEQGITMKEFVESAVRAALSGEKGRKQRVRVKFPLIESKNPGPVVTLEEINRAIEEADIEEALDDAYPNRR